MLDLYILLNLYFKKNIPEVREVHEVQEIPNQIQKYTFWVKLYLFDHMFTLIHNVACNSKNEESYPDIPSVLGIPVQIGNKTLFLASLL